jgi:hypothetical protein
VEPLEEHVQEVQRGRRWRTPFAVQGWVSLTVGLTTAIVIAAAVLA